MISNIYNFVLTNPAHIILLLIIAYVIFKQVKIIGYVAALFFVFAAHYFGQMISHYLFMYNEFSTISRASEYVFTFLIALVLINAAAQVRRNIEEAKQQS